MLRTLSCCAMFAAITLLVPAAARADAPSVASLGVIVTGGSTATFSGRVGPGGLATTTHFEYGTTPDLLQRTPDIALGAGTEDVSFDAKVTDLVPGTRYYVAIYAANVDGDGYGTVREFTTPRKPVVQALPATDVNQVSATLHLRIETRGLPVTLTGALSRGSLRSKPGAPTVTIPIGPVTVTTDSDVALPVAGLEPDTIYRWSVDAKSDGGTGGAGGTVVTPRLVGILPPRPSVKVAPYGSQVTFSGAIPAAAGLTVGLQKQPFPFVAPFAAIAGASGAAAPDGAYTLSAPALERARYAVAVASPLFVAPVQATAVDLRVAATVRARWTRVRGHRFVVSGSYAPDVPARVVLLRRGRGRVAVAVSAKSAGGKRAFRFPARALKPGAYEVRVAVGQGVEVEDAKSASFRIPRR